MILDTFSVNWRFSKKIQLLIPVLFFLFFLLAGSIESRAQFPYIYVCNEGTTPVFVATLRVNYSIFGTSSNLRGWTKVEPDQNRGFFQRCGTFDADGTTHLVFGIYNNDKEFGVVKYNFNNSCLDCNFKKEQICVKFDGMDYNSSSISFLPPCPEGFTAVPTSRSVYAQGNAKLTLTMNPTPNDNISVYLTPRKQPPVSPTTTVPKKTAPKKTAPKKTAPKKRPATKRKKN